MEYTNKYTNEITERPALQVAARVGQCWVCFFNLEFYMLCGDLQGSTGPFTGESASTALPDRRVGGVWVCLDIFTTLCTF